MMACYAECLGYGAMTTPRAILGVLGFFPIAVLAASPLHLECSADQTLPGRALACEYSMVGRLNAEFADLHDQTILAGRAGSNESKRWVAARDACKTVDCLERLFEAGIREARLVLDEVDSRQPAPLLTNARGVELRIVQKSAAAPPPAADDAEEAVSQGAPETAASLVMIFFFVAALGYALVARRLAA